MAQYLTLVCPIDSASRQPQYSSKHSERRGLFRRLLTAELQRLTGSPDARMRYNEHDFWKHVIKRFRYKLVGWPESIPFKDLSEVKGGQGPVAELLHLWYKGKLAFVRVESASEVAALKPQTVRTRASRCDLKSHWSQLTASGKPRRCHHRGAITPLTVTEDVDARVDAEVDAMVEGTGGGQRVAQGEIAEDRIESW